MNRVTCYVPECDVRRAHVQRAHVRRARATCYVLALIVATAAPLAARSLPLPDLRATDMRGATWTTGQLRGRVTVIDFWATWCAPCLAELPRLKRMRESYPRHELEILGVALEPGARRTLASWLNRNRIDWPQIQERGYDGPLASAFGVRSLPATVVVDADGRISAIGLRGEALERHVAELIKQDRQKTLGIGSSK